MQYWAPSNFILHGTCNIVRLQTLHDLRDIVKRLLPIFGWYWVIRVWVIIYSTAYRLTPSHGTQLNPQLLFLNYCHIICHIQKNTAHRHLSMCLHIVFMELRATFRIGFVCLKLDRQRCEPHGKPTIWPLEDQAFCVWRKQPRHKLPPWACLWSTVKP